MPTTYLRGRAYILFGCHASNEKFADACGQTFTVSDLKAALAASIRKSQFQDACIIWQRCRVNRVAQVLGHQLGPRAIPERHELCKTSRKLENRSDWYSWFLKAGVQAIACAELTSPRFSRSFSPVFHFEVAPYGEPTSRERRQDGSLDYQGLSAIMMAAALTRNLETTNIAPVMKEIIKALHEREYGTDDFAFCYEMAA